MRRGAGGGGSRGFWEAREAWNGGPAMQLSNQPTDTNQHQPASTNINRHQPTPTNTTQTTHAHLQNEGRVLDAPNNPPAPTNTNKPTTINRHHPTHAQATPLTDVHPFCGAPFLLRR